MTVSTLQAVLISVLAVSGLIGIYIAFSVLIRVLVSPEEAMSSFQKNPAQTIRDFQLLVIMESVMFGGFIMYTLGGIAQNEALLNTARIVAILFVITLAFIFFRWERRII